MFPLLLALASAALAAILVLHWATTSAPSYRRVDSSALEPHVRGLIMQYAAGSSIVITNRDGSGVHSIEILEHATHPSLMVVYPPADGAEELLADIATRAGVRFRALETGSSATGGILEGATDVLIVVAARFIHERSSPQVSVQFRGEFDLKVGWKSIEEHFPVVEEMGGPFGRLAVRSGRKFLDRARQRDDAD